MPNSAFVNFLFLLIYRHRAKHSAIFVISTIIVALFSAVMLLSAAIERDIALSLDAQPDFIVQKMRSGKVVDTPLEWADEFGDIAGVSGAVPRVYGQYFHQPDAESFTIVGIDLFDAPTSKSLKTLVDGLDVRQFISRNHMIIGSGVKAFFERYHFFDDYTFRTPEGKREQVFIYDAFPPQSDILSNDVIIMDIELAKTILGIDEEHSTDIILMVPNELEHDNIRIKLILTHSDIRVIEKREIQKAYAHLFNYKGGLFLVLYMVVLVTFILILYQRYSMISGPDRREIGILRAVGWSIKDVIGLKVAESLVIALAAFFLGVLIAYFYVFILDAPLLMRLFFGSDNLPVTISVGRHIDFGMLGMLFLFFMVPFIASVLIPVWKIAVTDPLEAMK